MCDGALVAELIAKSPNALEYITPKMLGEEFVKTFGQYIPEGVIKNLKANSKDLKIKNSH